MKILNTILLVCCMLLFTASCQKEEESINNAESTVQKAGENDGDENERTIKPESLPQFIKDDISARYPGAQLTDADEITHNDGKITYDVELKHNGSVFEVMYDAEGNFLGLEVDDSDENDEEDD